MFWRNHSELIAQLRADLAASEANVAEWQRLHEQERRRYDELLQTVLVMKTAGAHVVPVAGSVLEPLPERTLPFDELKALIAEKAGKNTELRGIMLRQLAKDRADGISEEDIAARIMSGVQADGVPG